MLCRLVSFCVGALALAVPLSGGGSGRVRDGGDDSRPSGAGRSADLPAPTALDSVPLQSPARAAPGFPLFLRSLDRDDGTGMRAAPRGQPAGPREVLLTFDDGPDLAGTPLVLSELDRRGLKAVFFVNGRMLIGDRPADRARRDLLRKLVLHGHLIGNHTLDHTDLCADRAAMAHEIDDNAEMITAATGMRPVLFRSPYGARCRALSAALAERGYLNVGWNVDVQESRDDDGLDDGEAFAAAVIAQLQALPGRAIVLLHDTHPAAVRALPLILNFIENGQSAPAGRRGRRSARREALTIVDYSVFLARPGLPRLGIEPALTAVSGALSALPGLHVARARLGI